MTTSCKWEESCDCQPKDNYCQNCHWYWFIDSGYGFCRALPEHVVIPWCRDICSLFKRRQK